MLLPVAAGALYAGPKQRPAAARLTPLSDSFRPAKAGPSDARINSFREFSGKSPRPWRVRFNPRTALPEALVRGETRAYGPVPEAAALTFLEENRALLSVDPSELRLSNSRTFAGMTHLQYAQVHRGVPVEFAYVRVHLTADGRVTGYQAKYEPEIDIPLTPSIGAAEAKAAVLAHLGHPARSEAELVVFPDEFGGGLKLAWKIKARGEDLASGRWIYYINALDGSVLFRYDSLNYACDGSHVTTGTVRGMVYEISPEYGVAVSTPISDQYVWVNDYSSAAVTMNGVYCAVRPGKVFAGLKGPYFSVANFRGPGGHFDNGNGQWLQKALSVVSPPGYAPEAEYDHQVTINTSDWQATYPSGAFAKALPRFTTFDVGSMDKGGTVGDADHVVLLNGASHVLPNARTASYRGTRTNAFYGAAVESPEYTIRLVSDESGNAGSFTVAQSSYLVLTAAPGTQNNATGSFTWDASRFIDGRLDEVNAFYHLNKIRNYFTPINKDPSSTALPADLGRPIEVMVRAHGEADRLDAIGGMWNAFYDLEYDHIYFGDGPSPSVGVYNSFALDGTVVRHEYIHLVVNRIYPIINFGEFGALSEALADYFAISSFMKDNYAVTTTGNYIDAGEATSRNLAGGAPSGVRSMPDDWWGEIHEDSLILSQAMYKLRDPGSAHYLGTFGSGAFSGLPKADVFTYSALFYFPDNFANFYEAFSESCRRLDPAGCPALQGKIDSAFADHGIPPTYFATGDSYETAGGGGDLCHNNNGPSCAVDISTITSLNASVYPSADIDYYSFTAPAGTIRATLSLPAGGVAGTYNAYSLYLFDADRTYLTAADPVIYIGDAYGYCSPAAGAQCLTLSGSVTLEYSAPAAGRYYLAVSAAPTEFYGNGGVSSVSPYTLALDFSRKGSAEASVVSRLFDRDEVSFSMPYTVFEMNVHPSSPSLPSQPSTPGSELFYEYASLRDHNFAPIPLARTDLPSGYLETVADSIQQSTDGLGRDVLNGRVRLKPGFAARYPALGTVYLEVFGRNHMGRVLSMGVSNAIPLTADKSALTAYENIINSANSSAIIRYELLSAGTLTIRVYTVTGALVKTLFSGPVPAGKGTIEWDGRNSSGGRTASGIYYVKAEGPGLDAVEKIAVVR